MSTTEQPTTEFQISAVCTVTDPAERRRRLGRVYGLILDFGRQKSAAAEAQSDILPQPTD